MIQGHLPAKHKKRERASELPNVRVRVRVRIRGVVRCVLQSYLVWRPW